MLLNLRAVLIGGLVAVLEVSVDLGRDHAFGHGNIDRGHQRFVDLLAGLLPLLHPLESAHAGTSVLAELIDRVELRGHRHELLVEGRQFTLADRGDGRGDGQRHPGPVSVARSERERARFSGARAAYRVVEAWQHAVGAHLVRHGTAGEVVDVVAGVGRSRNIHQQDIPVGARPVNVLE